jgi:hypothetical protein
MPGMRTGCLNWPESGTFGDRDARRRYDDGGQVLARGEVGCDDVWLPLDDPAGPVRPLVGQGAKARLAAWLPVILRVLPEQPVGCFISLLRRLFALASSGGAKVDEVAALRGVVPDAGLVLRAVVEDH